MGAYNPSTYTKTSFTTPLLTFPFSRTSTLPEMKEASPAADSSIVDRIRGVARFTVFSKSNGARGLEELHGNTDAGAGPGGSSARHELRRKATLVIRPTRIVTARR